MVDASGWQGFPDREFSPTTTEEVAAIVREASAQKIPITVAGSRTGLTGGCCPNEGWLICLNKLNSVAFWKHGGFFGAGTPLKTVNEMATQVSHFYPPDPTEWTASLGGTIATNASGSRSYRYGSTRKHVGNLECVMADGSIRNLVGDERIDFDVPSIPLPHTTKNTAGYRLQPHMLWKDLICGSEGTLAIVTRASVSFTWLPQARETAVLFFESDTRALTAVEILRTVEDGSMIEYFDAASLDLLREQFPEIPNAARAAILFEQEVANGPRRDLNPLPELPDLMDDSWIATSNADRERFRRFRHALPERVNDIVRRNGFQKLGSDYAVPVDQNAAMLAAYRETLDREFPGRYVLFGHIGDAHLHANILPTTQAEFDRGQAVLLDLARTAVSLGGTVSAEHGLGKRKAHLLSLQYSPEHIEAMKAVKRRLDPHWLLGRGNLFGADQP